MLKVAYNSSQNFPLSVLLLPLVLTLIGLIALFSISVNQFGVIAITAFTKQLLFMIPAIGGFLIILFIPKYIIHKYIYLAYGIILLLVTVPFLLSTIAGTHRWINIGLPVAFQPSEFAKWIVVVSLAKYLSDHNLEIKKFPTLIFPILIALFPAAIILQQPDLGTALILLTPVFPMLYWVGSRPFHLFILMAPIFSIGTAFHNVSFTSWAIIMGIIIYIARPN